jgi:regulator of RNase E activity RraA
VRNIKQRSDPLAAKTHVNRMAEFEAHNLAEDGDVLVISGVSGVSNMGGISSYTGQRQGERGAIVMGGVRDVRHSRSIGYPVWASEITPVTGKWRLETVEINGEIQMGDVRVNAGDLVVADDTGVVFIPRAEIMRVLELCEKKKKAEDERVGAISQGVPVPVFYGKG